MARGGVKGRSGKVSTPEAKARRMAAAAAGGAGHAAQIIARKLGGDTPPNGFQETAGYIMQRQKAQMAKASIQAQLLKLELDEKKGVLRPVAQVDAVLSRVAAVLRRTIRVAPSMADGLGLPADEAARLRTCLTTLCNQLTAAMAKELEGVAQEVEQMEKSATPAPEPPAGASP